jgi:hypothetical protein
VQLEGLGKLKKHTSSGLKSVIFQLVAQCLNQLRFGVEAKNIVFGEFQLTASFLTRGTLNYFTTKAQ